MTATVYMLVGLPASGKSTWTKENAENLEATVLSSDKVREEWYGDSSIQKDPVKIFEYIYKTAKELLDEGKNVIIDATNISQKRRVQFNKEFEKYKRVAVYFNTSYLKCIRQDFGRERTVGEGVIKRMFHNLQVPTYAEGWNDVQIVYDEYIKPFENKEYFESMLNDKLSHEGMFDSMHLCMFYEFDKIYNMPQDNPYHSFSVSRHTYYVYDYIYNNYHEDDRLTMLWVAVLHDVGKGYTKTFENHKRQIKRHASFYGHENCSAQIAVSILHSLGYDDSFILDVAELCQQHMKLLNASEKGEKRLKNLVGEDMFDKLVFFREADLSAK